MLQDITIKYVKKEDSLMNVRKFLVSLGFSILFTLMMVYLTFEAPILINELLLNCFPDYGLMWKESAIKIVEIMRPFGYVAFLLTLILVLTGFLTKRLKLSVLGSIVLYIPIFGHFVSSMFYFAGIGLLRLLWLPIFDISPEALRLGEIVYLPYRLLPSSLHSSITVIILATGFLTLCIGTTTWFFGKLTGNQIIDFWIYKYSRHPQYLGGLVWSYGVLTLIEYESFVQGGYVPLPSLPWLLFALIIIGVALDEENDVLKKHYVKYLRFRATTPFMFPLPNQVSMLIITVNRLLLSKDYPENVKEIAVLLAFYGMILILLSLPIIMLLSY
ncbi:MAG: hypothetical protein ACFE95_07115 [Candidatus Hodarchaeota archaeon]